MILSLDYIDSILIFYFIKKVIENSISLFIYSSPSFELKRWLVQRCSRNYMYSTYMSAYYNLIFFKDKDTLKLINQNFSRVRVPIAFSF
jgi:methionine salvage enolase-phosphatase E1